MLFIDRLEAERRSSNLKGLRPDPHTPDSLLFTPHVLFVSFVPIDHFLTI